MTERTSSEASETPVAQQFSKWKVNLARTFTLAGFTAPAVGDELEMTCRVRCVRVAEETIDVSNYGAGGAGFLPGEYEIQFRFVDEPTFTKPVAA